MSPTRAVRRLPVCAFACALVAASPWRASAQNPAPVPRAPASEPASPPPPDAAPAAPSGPTAPPTSPRAAEKQPAPDAGAAEPMQIPVPSPATEATPTPAAQPAPGNPAQAAPAPGSETVPSPAPETAPAPETEIPPATIEQLQQAHEEKAALARSAYAQRTAMLQGRLDKAARAERESSMLVPWFVTGTGIAATLLGLGVGVGRALSCADTCTQAAWPGWTLVVGATVATAGSLWLVIKSRDQAELRDRRRRLEEELRRERWQAGSARRELTLSGRF